MTPDDGTDREDAIEALLADATEVHDEYRQRMAEIEAIYDEAENRLSMTKRIEETAQTDDSGRFDEMTGMALGTGVAASNESLDVIDHHLDHVESLVERKVVLEQRAAELNVELVFTEDETRVVDDTNSNA